MIPVPTIAKQEEIVKIVNQYVKHENDATDVTDQVEEQIEQTRKSILSQAFHGELNLK